LFIFSIRWIVISGTSVDLPPSCGPIPPNRSHRKQEIHPSYFLRLFDSKGAAFSQKYFWRFFVKAFEEAPRDIKLPGAFTLDPSGKPTS
jgi:hypothetical protein